MLKSVTARERRAGYNEIIARQLRGWLGRGTVDEGRDGGFRIIGEIEVSGVCCEFESMASGLD